MNLSLRLKNEREKRGMTQTDFGNLFGLGKVTYSRYETGSREPNLDLLCLMADVLNVSTDWLLGRSVDNADRPVTVSNNREHVDINSHNGGDCANCPLAKAAGLFLSSSAKRKKRKSNGNQKTS